MTGQLFKQFKYQIFLFLSGFFIFISASNCTKNPFFGLEPTPNDKEGPEINLINPTPNQKVSGFFTVIGTTSDKYEVKSVEIKIDNGNYITANGTVTFHIEINTQELTEGTHTLTVKSTDNTGNARLISRDFIVDQSVPDVDITMDYDLYQNYLKGVQVILSGTASDKNGLSNDRIGVSKVQISFNGGVVFNDTVLSADGKSWTYTIADTSTLKPGDGDLTLVLKAIDSAGLIGTSNSPLWVDNTNPSLSITSPVDGNAYIYGNDLTVLGTCSDNITNGIKEIRITIGSLAPELISCGTDGNFSITKDVSSLSSYPITAIIIDKAGNQKQTAINPVFEKRVKKPAFLTDPGTYSEAKSIVLSVDTTGAVIRYTLDGTTPNCTTTPVYSSAISLFSTKTIQAIACKDGFVNSEILSGTFTINDTGLPSIEFINPTVDQKVSGLVSFIGKTSDNIGVTLVEYKIDNGSYSPASGTLVWYFVLDTSSLSEGSHTMTIRATDGHGNSSEEQQTFIVDQTIPSVAVNLNYNLYENYIRGTNRTLSGTASDNNGVSKVQISFNGGVSFFDTILADGGTTWSYLIPNTASLIPGDASITAVLRVVDVTGIIGTVYFPLIIDNTNPGGAILSPVNNISIDGSADLNSYNLVVSGSCTDNTASGVKNVVITVGPLSSDTVSCGGDNTFSFSKNILSIKNNGPISVSALITDKSGNTNTFTNYIALDDSPPYFTGNLTTPKGILNNDLTKSANNFKSGTYVIQGRVTDETAADMLTTISEIKFKIDTIPATTPLVETLIDNYIKDQELPDDDDSLNNGKSIDSSGNWSHQFDTSAIPDGTYLITLTVKNNRGGFGTFQKTIRIDKTIPSLSDVAPVENAKISGTAVSISGYADSTGSDIASIRIQINDGTVINADYETDKFFNFTDYTNFTYAGGYFSWIWDTTSPYNYPVSATKHTIVLTAEDLAGNQGLFTVNVEKNAAAPLISFTEYDHPTNSAYIQKPLTNGRYINGSGKIRGTASVQVGGASLTSIQIKIDNGSWVDISGASFVEPDLPSASTVWEYTLPGLLPGSRKIYISAVDNLGNANTVTFQVL
ncbi:MAG TPA: hypothetical protein DHW82_06330, partial [Spirochaetia bacterium]|nr:hypothetical protein [Spirochaetia bacterium]